MSLSREHLESGYFQRLAAELVHTGRPAPLTAEQLDASLLRTLDLAPSSEHVWVFGYGSLVWNPLLDFDQHERVRLHGYRRRFCLRTELSRGSREYPGLILGLEPGGCCQGVAYRLAGHGLVDELRLLWKREMVTGAYHPRWVRLRGESRMIRGLAFVMNRDYPFYAGGLDDAQTATMLATARGPLGTCAEYLFKTHEGLLAHGIRDTHLTELVRRVRALGCAFE
ncbi:MAG: gamma-glutamylcyclotransferase [Burkholderiaceae bacterium]